MNTDFSDRDRKKIEDAIRKKYATVAVSAEGLFSYPTGSAELQALRYDPDILRSLPDPVLKSFCGVGNPLSLGTIEKGESVLDIGCGGGVDTMIAATLAGTTGKAVGIDVSPEMVERAEQNLSLTHLKNVSFEKCSAENLPFPDKDFDVVVSNGVFNLIPDKLRALEETFRIMKPEGRLMMADQVLSGQLSEDVAFRIENWAG